MLLRNIFTPLPRHVLDALEDCGIKTDEDLIFGDVIEIWQKISDDTVTLQDIEDARVAVATQQAAPMVRGDELLRQQADQQELREENAISCGIIDIDELIRGFSKYRLVEVSGDKGSGKTVSSQSLAR